MTLQLKSHLFGAEKTTFSAEKVPFQHPYFLLELGLRAVLIHTVHKYTITVPP